MLFHNVKETGGLLLEMPSTIQKHLVALWANRLIVTDLSIVTIVQSTSYLFRF